jgi:transposase
MAAAPLLLRLRGIGPEFATVLPLECLNKAFDNRRQVAAFAGLAPTPWASGSVEREQGISKAGNRRLRTTLIELAWSWQRHQPDSTLTQWFHKRIKGQGARVKRIAIVALARKLLVALWRYVKHGLVPEGAVLKAA